jgi:tRNA(Ile)-lysidine synthase TilS/MesJ
VIEDILDQIRITTKQAHKLIIPVSGGSDSALLFLLATEAVREKAIGVFIGDGLREEAWFKQQGNIVQLKKYDSLPQEAEVLRWAQLLNYSNEHKAWLLSSRTKTENMLGNYSLAYENG